MSTITDSQPDFLIIYILAFYFVDLYLQKLILIKKYLFVYLNYICVMYPMDAFRQKGKFYPATPQINTGIFE